MTARALRAAALAFAGGLFVVAAILLIGSRPLKVPLVLPTGHTIRVELARTDQERARGLMFRHSMPADEGMLIVFPAPGRHGIWMRNCRFPLDLVWLDSRRSVVDVALAAAPCLSGTCPIYWPARSASSVLEVNAGIAVRHGLRRGAVLPVPLP